MEKSIKYLKESLTYQMSLGSKELFHSNVWAWLMDNENEFIKVFFNINLSIYEKITIEREKQNRDVIIKLEKGLLKNYLVIENKIKSLPTIEQLKKYTIDLKEYRLIGAVFTGLVNPFENESLEWEMDNNRKVAWQFIRYDQIANKIKEIVLKSDKDLIKEKKEQILEYCNIVKNIDVILTSELDKSNNRLSYCCNEELKNLRMNDVFIKLKGADFYCKAKKFLSIQENIGNGFKFVCWQSFNNGNATLDFRFSNREEDSKSWVLVGVQIQGGQYRFVAERNKYNDGKKNCDEVFEEFAKYDWFDTDFNKNTNNKVWGIKTSMSPTGERKFNKYDGNDYSMAYQYFDINEENNLYENLFIQLKNDLTRALKLLKEKIIPNLG